MIFALPTATDSANEMGVNTEKQKQKKQKPVNESTGHS